MLIAFAAVVALLGQTPEPVRTLAVPGFAFTGVDAAVGAAWQERFVSRLSGDGLKVTSAADIQQLLGLERQRQLLGCSSENGCLAELAGALGVELILTGSIVKSESGYVASLRVLRTKDGQAVVSATERLKTEEALLDWLDVQAPSLRAALVGSRGNSSAVVRWVPAMFGAGALIASGVFFGLSNARYTSLISASPPELADIAGVRRDGETFMTLGIGFGIGGAVAVLTSVLWAALAPSEVAKTVQPVAALTHAGGFFGVQGTWP